MSNDSVPVAAMQMRLRVGKRLRELRAERSWSQQRLAEQAGITRWSVYRTELALNSASLDHLTLMADALGVPLSHLVRS